MFKKKKKDKELKENEEANPEEVGGSLQISNDVIADLAGYAALTCYGVVGMQSTKTTEALAGVIPLHPSRKGIEVEQIDDCLTVTLHVIIDSGTKLASVSKNLKNSVEFILKTCAQIDDCDVRVVIGGITRKKPARSI